MEQDIKILEELKNIFLSLKYHGYINDVKKDISTDGVINAIENILKERQQDKEKIKDLEEINEAHKKENGELRERVKELEEENKIVKGNYYTLCADIQMVTSELGFPEDTIIADEFVSMIKENYIEKSLVEEKIEELKSKSGGNVFHIQQTINAEIRLLQELLEKRK